MSSRTAFRRGAALSALGMLVTTALAATTLTATAAPLPTPAATAAAEHSSLVRALSDAAAEYGVPRDLLVAVAYGESHLDGHDGKPSQAGGYGVMHLVSNSGRHTLEQASALTGVSVARLREDTAANIRGGAAVLRAQADALGMSAARRADTDAWFEAVARYGGATDVRTARLYADTVYTLLARGFTTRTDTGEQITVGPRPTDPDLGALATAAPFGTAAATSADYPNALWVPAYSGNYAAGRTSQITHVVIHVTQGSYAGSISWFQNPDAEVSAHYVIRSSDGQVTQMVRDQDTAWHARSGNAYSIGIEHEGWIDEPEWFTDAMYRSSAALTRHLCDEYGIPMDRTHIVGHSEVPGNDHTDPGPNWDWNYYLSLVRDGASGSVQLSFDDYATIRSGAVGGLVTAAQYLLNQQGHNAGSVDGVFGSGTERAVKEFQTAHGLTADGIVGARTWTALLSAGSTPALSQSSKGEAVQRLQRALTAALGRTVSADGVFGSGTAQAVRDYQSSRGLTADALVGPATWGALQAGR